MLIIEKSSCLEDFFCALDELWRVFYRFTVFLPPIGGYKRELLFEDELCEVVETVLPYCEVVTFVRIVDEYARNTILIAECLELGAVEHQSVCTTTYHPEEFVLFLNLVDIRNNCSGKVLFVSVVAKVTI